MTANITIDPFDAFFMGLNPYTYAAIGTGFAVSISVVAAAWGIFLVGSTILGAAVAYPRIRTKNLISVIFCEAVAIYGIIMGIIFELKLENKGALYYSDYFAGFNLFWAGMAAGFCNLACGISVGITGSACAIADAANGDLFIRILVVEIFASALGLFGLIVSLIQATSVDFGHQVGPIPVNVTFDF